MIKILICAVVALAASVSAAHAGFTLNDSEPDFLTLSDGAVPVLRYVRGEILAPGVPEDRRRSTYIHPLYTLDGRPMSDDFPPDHHHHRGLSWMWLKVSFDGITKDLWTLKGIRQIHASHQSSILSSKAVLLLNNTWVEDSTGRDLLNEQVRLTVYPVTKTGRIIDFHLRLAAVSTPVTIGVSGTGYSGLNLRFAPRAETIITTPLGETAKDENRQPYEWADLSGTFGNVQNFDGVTIFSHPANPNNPPGWTLRPYGVLNPAFTSRGTDYTIKRTKPLDLKYRLLIHSGKADKSAIAAIAKEYR